ncbi:sensor histidine kinase [Flavobacterium sp. AG291]|uniref:sensor histidine kinase n=1 Tax=Flavobacterium sp. AG291 TaxID=2184000 RepID=UPI000E0B0D31|nr:HAMP domain-containing sensor histidine kinase [Flavobacterium sp. AG291]
MKLFCNYILKLLLLLLFSQQMTSQQNYNYQWFSADSKHLPQNSVKSITADKYGYIWLSTENGIVRYDGQNFNIYNSENTKGLSSNRMLLFTGSVAKDSIIILNERSETLLIHERAVKNMDTIKYRKKLYTLLSRDAYFQDYYKQRQKPLAISVKDRTYIFTQDSVSIYNSNYKLTQQKKHIFNQSDKFFVSSGDLYIVNEKNEYSLFSEINKSFQKFGYDFTKKIEIFSNNIAQQAFLFSDDKLFYLRKTNDHLVKELIFEGFNYKANNIVSAYYDEKNEVLYLGSSNKGLLVVKRNDFRHNIAPNEESNGNSNIYYALTQLGDNKILTSTGEIFSDKGEKSAIDIEKYSDKFAVLTDKNGNIWTKKLNSVYRFTKKSNFKKFNTWDLNRSARCIAKGANGNIYIGAYSQADKGALYTINPNEDSPAPQLISKIDFPPTEIVEVDGKTLWCGSWEGLYKFNLNTKKTERVKEISSTTHVRSIYASSPGEIWLGTYNNGFFLYRKGKFTHMPKDRYGYLLTTHCIIEDKEGVMWLTTNKGLFAAQKQDLFDYADNKTKTVYYNLYDKSLGFLNNEFNGGCTPCGVNVNQKTIFFPSMDGIVYFNPLSVHKRLPDSGIYLDEIEVDSTTYAYNNSKFVFDRHFGKIKFFISSPFFGNAYNKNIETRLEGPVVQNWTPMTETNVSFSTLPPGEYTLKIRKLSGFGSKYIYKDIQFSITPAFWQTGWFTVVLVALGLLVIYLSVKLRIRYIKHKNIQLEKQVVLRTEQLQSTVLTLRKTKEDLSVQVKNHKNLIKTITHDIKSPLKFIALTGKYLYNNLEKTGSVEKEDVKAIHTSSTQLYHFVDNFLEYAKETDLNNTESEPYSIRNLAEEKITFFKNIATAAKTKLYNYTDSSLFITINRHLLSIVLHNLLDNALKHTFDGSITITSSQKDNELSITVTDTGKGMSAEMVNFYNNLAQGNKPSGKPTGMGLHMIIELLVIIGGSLYITSSEKGTTITISFIRPN